MQRSLTLVVSLLLCAAFAAGASPSAGARPTYTQVRPGGTCPAAARASSPTRRRSPSAPDRRTRLRRGHAERQGSGLHSAGGFDRQWSVVHPTSITTTRAGDVFTLERRSSGSTIARYSQKTGRELDTWNPTGHGSLPASVFDPASPEIASSDAAGAPIYGLGFCPDGVDCRQGNDLVTRWDRSGRVTGTWDIHEENLRPQPHIVVATALATDRQNNFYVAERCSIPTVAAGSPPGSRSTGLAGFLSPRRGKNSGARISG